MKHSVSIAMATFNGAAFLSEQLDSIAKQTVVPMELHIGDDGSTDETESIIAAFALRAPFPVYLHRNAKRLGYGENFLRTAQRCSGDWIAFCDQDDVWLDTKLGQALAATNLASDVMLVIHDARLVDSDGRPIGQALYGLQDAIFKSLEMPGAFVCAGFLQMFRGSLVRDFPIWPRTESPHDLKFEELGMTRYPHDSWIPLLANLFGSIVSISDQLALYRRHDSTVTSVASLGERRMLRNVFNNNADRYQSLGDWYARSADALTQQAEQNSQPALSKRILKAAEKFSAESRSLILRAELYRSKGIAAKLRGFGRLIRSGAYLRRWTMTTRSMVKDLAWVTWARHK